MTALEILTKVFERVLNLDSFLFDFKPISFFIS